MCAVINSFWEVGLILHLYHVTWAGVTWPCQGWLPDTPYVRTGVIWWRVSCIQCSLPNSLQSYIIWCCTNQSINFSRASSNDDLVLYYQRRDYCWRLVPTTIPVPVPVLFPSCSCPVPVLFLSCSRPVPFLFPSCSWSRPVPVPFQSFSLGPRGGLCPSRQF